MKTKLLCVLSLILISSITFYGQTSVSQAGIAVQGIARDANNTAIANQAIGMKFTIYYLDGSNSPVTIFTEVVTLNTDAFGVFSHVIDPGSTNNSIISNRQAFLKIEKGAETISNERLRHVPYAISANNGVPTGAIMPYLGTTAPEGWVLCDGNPLPSSAVDLIALVGNNAPDLRGMFLRGTGTSAVNGQDGPALKTTQSDTLKAHVHSSGSLQATSGNHKHSTDLGMDWTDADGDDGNDKRYGENNSDGTKRIETNDGGAHTHPISGTTGSLGGSETRPVNYGVNYIIKL